MDQAFHDYIESVRDRSGIAEVIGEHVELSSKNTGCCPFHDDHNPSFSVNAREQYFNCFACDAGGDVFRFIERILGVSFWEAVKILAERAGMPPFKASEEDVKTAHDRRADQDVLAATAAIYCRNLPEKAKDYLVKARCISPELIERFQIGWADGHLRDHLVTAGFSEEVCLRAGVLAHRNGRVRDFFLNRVVFPVLRHGRVVYLTGRGINDEEPKWLHLKGNRPDFYNAAALREKRVFVVEGVLDALALESWGYSAVALFGSRSGADQRAARLRRAGEIFLCLDGDEAGRSGTAKLGAALGQKARIVVLPDGKDPNDLLVSGDRETFDRCVAEARDPITWQIEAIPPDTGAVELADCLEPVLHDLAQYPVTKAEAILKGPISEWFSLKVKDQTPYLKRLRDLRTRLRREDAQKSHGSSDPGSQYVADDTGTYWVKKTDDGPTRVRLANFTAEIVEAVTKDDGAETTNEYTLEVTLMGGKRTHRIPAASFASMAWIYQALSPRCILEAGQSTKDKFRAAIQHLSPNPNELSCFTHLGWRKIEGIGWCYLNGGRTIGPKRSFPELEVRLEDSLSRYALLPPETDDEARQALRESLRLLELAPDEITYPLFASIWRAALGKTDFSLFVVGPTGTLKTAISAVFLSHWGAGLDDRHLPASWSSTENFLEALAFLAKDAWLVVDDFAPAGSIADVQRYCRAAERIIRGQGNRSGRGRMQKDSTLRTSRPPRGLVVATGEDLPPGQSLRSRAVVLEISPDIVDLELLTECQKAAAEGTYSKALVAFLQVVATHYENTIDAVRKAVLELRAEFHGAHLHGRTASNAAELLAGFDVWLQVALAVEAITEDESQAYRERCVAALRKVVLAQVDHVASEEPTERFCDLLGAAFTSEAAHAVDSEGKVPGDDGPGAWGWREKAIGTGSFERTGWQPQGPLIACIAGDDLYIFPTPAVKAAKSMATGPDGLTLGTRTLGKRLAEKGLLVSQDEVRGRHTVRVTIAGKQRGVWHMRADSVLQSTAKKAKSAMVEGERGLQGTPRLEPEADPDQDQPDIGLENRPNPPDSRPAAELSISDRPIRPFRSISAGNPPADVVGFPRAPGAPCRCCSREEWWIGKRGRGEWTCGYCHKPAALADEIVWLKDLLAERGPAESATEGTVI